MRVFALFSHNKKLVIPLAGLFGTEAAFMLSVVIYSMSYVEIGVGELVEGTTVCGENRFVPSAWGTSFWCIPLAFEAILLFLSLYKASQYWRESAGIGGLTLVKVLLQDQAIYFFLVMICSVSNITGLWTDSSLATDYMYALSSTSFPCIIGSRLLFHLEEAVERGGNRGTSHVISIETMSDLEFA
ncbi:hypothetical protein M0805_009782 [Coniferiporia weirii]|nr:hypothetical protein M0805_009782 [Coniferiporia weirii]